jgi:hypothetical protein
LRDDSRAAITTTTTTAAPRHSTAQRHHGTATRATTHTMQTEAMPLTVTDAEIDEWFALIATDAAEAKAATPPMQAKHDGAFEAAMMAKFPVLGLYEGPVVGEGEGGRKTGKDERRAVISSLSTMTLALACARASPEKQEEIAEIVRRPQVGGEETLFGVKMPTQVLTTESLVELGSRTAEMVGASFFVLVVHDLPKIVKMRDGFPVESTDGEILSAVLSRISDGGEYDGSLPAPETMTEICKLFAMDFEASQFMQCEVTTGADVFMSAVSSAPWFLNHYLWDVAGILAAHHGYIGSATLTQPTYDVYTMFLSALANGKGDLMGYLEERLKIAGVSASLDSLVAELGLPGPLVRTAVARTVAMARVTSKECGQGLVKCWHVAVTKFGPDRIGELVKALSDPAAPMLKYAPKVLNSAAKSERWEVQVSARLAYFALCYLRSSPPQSEYDLNPLSANKPGQQVDEVCALEQDDGKASFERFVEQLTVATAAADPTAMDADPAGAELPELDDAARLARCAPPAVVNVASAAADPTVMDADQAAAELPLAAEPTVVSDVTVAANAADPAVMDADQM